MVVTAAVAVVTDAGRSCLTFTALEWILPLAVRQVTDRRALVEASGSSGHYEIRVVSKAFADKSTLEKQRWSMERLRL